MMLCGYPPFYDEREFKIFKLIKACEWVFPEEDWESVSSEAKDFISKLLVKDPKERMTADEALNHPWILSKIEKPLPDERILSRLREFKKPGRF